MSAAIVAVDGKTRVLDGKAEPDDVITEADVTDASKLARGLTGMAKLLATLRRRYSPRRIDFEDVAVGAFGAMISLEHGFAGRVRWWPVSFQAAASSGPGLQESPNSTSSTLILFSFVAGTATIRVEEAG